MPVAGFVGIGNSRPFPSAVRTFAAILVSAPSCSKPVPTSSDVDRSAHSGKPEAPQLYRRLTFAIADGAGGGADSGPNENTLSSVTMFDIVARKGGVLPVGNVQFLLQFEPRAIPYFKVSAHSDIETEPASIDDDGRFRIRLKNPLAPTARDVRIGVEITMTGHRKDRVFMQMGTPLRGVWLYSDAIAGLPISLPSSRQNADGNEVR